MAAAAAQNSSTLDMPRKHHLQTDCLIRPLRTTLRS